jgi:pimeloyl-ACP methyl ester carboxylesterase
MHDLVIVLPGILGSVLEKDGREIWEVSGRAIWEVIRDSGSLLNELTMIRESDGASFDDGVHATRLVSGFHGIFGLWKIDGYDLLNKLIREKFQVNAGVVSNPRPDENFFEFPYDWRRSNRDSAKLLKLFIDRQLHAWRRYSGWDQAKVILLAHSMGGLVARYALEVLEAWPNCRALVTFGTPFRGSFDALQYLANGMQKGGFDLSGIVRSMPSVYELCPIYEGVELNGKWFRPAELPELPASVDRSMLQAGLAFHREIEASVAAHRHDSNYLVDHYAMVSLVGTEQPTLQVGSMHGGHFTASDGRAPNVTFSMRGGDGRVPRVSAIPVDSDRHATFFHCMEKHGSLQANPYFLGDLHARLQHFQGAGNLHAIRGADQPTPQLSISLQADDLYMADAPIVVTAQRLGPDADRTGLRATIQQRIGGNARIEKTFAKRNSEFELDLTGLQPGQYQIAVRSTDPVNDGSGGVHDVFEIASNR